jgi:uncharacterized protein involved in type VI secretion and phage assembly
MGGQQQSSLGPTSHVQGEYRGVVVALVTNNRSPDGAMVKVKYPWLPDGPESGWARLATPMTGNGRGFYWLPEVNDEVLVAFEHGDINRPYVIGGVWNGQDQPPASASDVVGPDGKVNKRIVKSRLGHVITIDDSDDSPSISIVDKTGSNQLTLDSNSNSLKVSVRGDIVFHADNKITFSGGEIALSSNRTGVSLEAQTELKLKGMQASMNADTQLKLSSPMTDMEGTGIVSVHGGMVKLN